MKLACLGELMSKKTKVLGVIFALCASFLLGWRVMPKIWPTIRLNYINRLIPQLQSSSESEEKTIHYTPKSNSQYGDPILSSDSLIYYFYKDSCVYCLELEPLISGLPDQITLPDGSTSKIKLLCLNKVEEKYNKIIADYYEEHNIPDDQRYVPAIVIGDKYLFLKESIEDQLMNSLVAGEGLQTEMLEGAQRVSE